MGEHTLKLKAAAAVLAAGAAIAAVPATAGAAVRPAVSGICNYNLAIFPSSDSAGPTAVVSGTIQFCGSSTWVSPYLVIWKTNAAGLKTFGASGIGQAVYQCQGTALNTFSMDGEIPTGVSYTMQMACG
jgi:hypothetical protein